jgi:hypothetical protein
VGRGRRGEGPRDPRLMSARSALPRSISFMFSVLQLKFSRQGVRALRLLSLSRRDIEHEPATRCGGDGR